METRKVYMVGYLKQLLDIRYKTLSMMGEVVEKVVTIPCTWSEGQLGAFAVFGSKEAAEAYQNGVSRYPIIEYEMDEPTKQ